MSIEVRVPTVLRKHTGGARIVQSQGGTVAAVLEDLDRQFPGLKQDLVGDDGQMRQFVNIYVNDEDIRYLQRLDTQIADGDELAILPAVAGGAGASSGWSCPARRFPHPSPAGELDNVASRGGACPARESAGEASLAPTT